MIVMKFGGSSLQTAERVREMGAIVKKNLDRRPVLVLSAMGNTTDDLIEAGRAALRSEESPNRAEIFHRNMIAQLGLSKTLIDDLLQELDALLIDISLKREFTSKTHDFLVSFGERLSVRLFSAHLNQIGVASSHFDGWDIGMRASSDFTRAEILPETYERVKEAFQKIERLVPVITGFIAKTQEGDVITLGRGGSDLTASVIGSALGVEEIQLWKDVYGILAADPRLVSEAKPIPQLSFAEAAELAYFGAKVLHPTSILPAMYKGVPVRVKNHRDPDHPGTLIVHRVIPQKTGVVAIAHKSDQVLVHIASTRMLGQSGFLATVFQIFAELKFSVDVIATSEVSISLTLGKHSHLSELQEKLQRIATVQIQGSKSIVSLIGETKRSSELLEKIMHALNSERIDIQMISHGASKINTSLIINDAEIKQCVKLLYQCFFKEENHS